LGLLFLENATKTAMFGLGDLFEKEAENRISS
jgi:hypothetical protein